MYSPDGRWIAYLASSTSPTTGPPGPVVLCVAKGDGSDPRALAQVDGPNGQAIRYVIGWSPSTSPRLHRRRPQHRISADDERDERTRISDNDVDVWQPGK